MGFDCVLIVFMAATAVLGWVRRQRVVLPGFTTGILLICDAWFDVVTAGSGRNLALWVLTLLRTQLRYRVAFLQRRKRAACVDNARLSGVRR
jgi:hypothetical protein